MNMLELHAPAYDLLLQNAGKAKLILLHPEARGRSLLVARLRNDPDARAYYYALDIDDHDLFSFLTGLSNSLSRQHATFGRHLCFLPPNALRHPGEHLERILSVFQRELSELTTGRFLLILDEFDRADPADAVHRFVERLSGMLPPGCAILLNGRTLPRMPWLAMMASGQGLILKDARVIEERLYERANPADASLKVLSLGPGFVFLNDRLVDDWEGQLPRLLLYYVAEQREVTRNQICATFWPELELEQAVNVFHVTKRRLHKALDIDVLSHDGKYYHIAPEVRMYLDAQDFVDLLMRCRSETAGDEMAGWQKLVKLYRGPFLEGQAEPWVVQRRAAYRAAYIEALTRIAELWVERGNRELALHTLRRAIEADYDVASLHLRLLSLYAELDRRAEALAHYRELEAWAKANNSSVNGETRRLIAGIMS